MLFQMSNLGAAVVSLILVWGVSLVAVSMAGISEGLIVVVLLDGTCMLLVMVFTEERSESMKYSVGMISKELAMYLRCTHVLKMARTKVPHGSLQDALLYCVGF